MVLTREAGNVLAGEGSTSKALREEGAALGVLEDGDDPPPRPMWLGHREREGSRREMTLREETMPGQAVEA